MQLVIPERIQGIASCLDCGDLVLCSLVEPLPMVRVNPDGRAKRTARSWLDRCDPDSVQGSGSPGLDHDEACPSVAAIRSGF